MREIYLLENTEACSKFVLERISQGYSLETFLGIGTFSSQKLKDTEKGIIILSSPAFLEKELSESVILGHFSVFEQDSLLLQVGEENHKSIPISRWFLVGQHLSLFSSPRIDVLRYLPIKELMGVRTPEEFMQVYLGYLFPNIQEVRAQSILFLFDIRMLCDYIRAFFMWLIEKYELVGLKESILNYSEMDLQKKVTEEFLWFLADSALHPCIGVYPSSQKCFEFLLQSARVLRKQGNLTDEVSFKL
ncbi:hypothetical protein [Fluviispira multicolorata]|uniref:Uncharacterized protein n=1 Tax=Fluviispira multicolorata TaxID=2654512 RepID=A0A833N5J5_9BACT|nr:hypothetical protein [Fluviispira multicolorata]KAB8030817.1 hypothetical protein GCL57_07535 [Fluviispira multicolorata]